MKVLKRLAERLHATPALGDGRSRKVILIPHCALNQNARVAGAAERPAAVVELITGLLEREIGIVQMPCPELCAFGMDRAHVTVELELRSPAGRELCRRLAQEQVETIKAYRAGGIRVLGILGKNGSPSCGVEETWDDGLCPGSGAFTEALAEALRDQGIQIGMTGIRDSEPDKALVAVDRWLASAEPR